MMKRKAKAQGDKVLSSATPDNTHTLMNKHVKKKEELIDLASFFCTFCFSLSLSLMHISHTHFNLFIPLKTISYEYYKSGFISGANLAAFYLPGMSNPKSPFSSYSV